VECSFLLKQKTSRWNAILAAAVIILIVNPLSLWSVSFQLSFAAVLSIMLIGSGMQRKVFIRGKIGQYIGGLLIVSVAAQIGTMPLTLHYFGQTSNYFALTNLLVIPLAFVLLLLGISTLALSWCVVGEWLGIAAKWCTWILREAIEWIESLPYSTTQLTLSAWSALALYGAILCGVMMMRGEKVRWWWLIGAIGCLLMVLYFELR
jgi:competence protein ComEC